jgi:hypothetical protein
VGAAYDATEEEAPWFEKESAHAEMLKRQIIGETRCQYEFCSDSSKHRTAVCPELHSRCEECHCRGHHANTLIRRDGENWAVCPKSKEINKLTVREIQMGFEMAAKRGLLTKYRHSTGLRALPMQHKSTRWHPTDHHVREAQLHES